MKICGIVTEYNPFHNGHLYHIEQARKLSQCDVLIAVMSGNYVQRGQMAIIDKHKRASFAVQNGVDIVLELPYIYATQSASKFAKGAIDILKMAKVDTICFGSETNNLVELQEIANTSINIDNLKELMNTGNSFPKAYGLLSSSMASNDILAVSYLKALKDTNIKAISIQRTNNYHDLTLTNISSASAIRNAINDKNDISNSVPSITKNFIRYVDEKKWFNYLKFKIISDLDYLNQYQTVDEGIENRIKKFIYDSNSLEELILNVKSKRFTYNKIKRMFTHILCGFKKEDAKDLKIEYIRVLGFNKNGQKVLNSVKKNLDVPIYFNYKEGLNKYFDLEFKTSVIYSLIVSDQSIVKKEFKAFPIKK